MIMLRNLFPRLKRDTRGSMVIETAIIVPVLALVSLGTFDVSRMFSRQNELQQAVAEAAQIALASKPDNSTKRDAIKAIIRTSTGLGAHQVTITNEYRCGSTATVSSTNNCGTSDVVTTYLKIVVTDSFAPVWSDFGVGSGYSFNITRKVIVA
jgi:Flp pilus assembly protein TadG